MSIQQTGDGVGMATKAIGALVGAFGGGGKSKNSSRTAEFDSASTAHKLLLAHQKAEHSHAASEAALNRAHQKDLVTHMATTFGHDPSRSFSVESDGGRVKYSSTASAKVAKSSTSKPKSPVETPAPTSTEKLPKTKQPTPPPTSVKSRKVK